MKTILIFGGTGFIGHNLINILKDDYKLIVFSRNPKKHNAESLGNVNLQGFDLANPEKLFPYFEQATGVINLAATNIGESRWTKSFKAQILNSRLDMGNFIRFIFENLTTPPDFLIQGSASGYYGINPSDAKITESRPSTRDSFLTRVAVNSEENIDALQEITRLVFIRTGIVLDKNEGALPKIALPFKMFAGGTVGNGKQWFPWIHINDVVAAIKFILSHEDITGPVNLTAPNPLRQKDFARALGKTLNRPAIVPAPGFALRLLLGKEKADDLLLSGLRVVPDKLLSSGFRFQFETINVALKDIYK